MECRLVLKSRECPLEEGASFEGVCNGIYLETQNTFFFFFFDLPHVILLRSPSLRELSSRKWGVDLCFINRWVSTCDIPFCYLTSKITALVILVQGGIQGTR